MSCQVARILSRWLVYSLQVAESARSHDAVAVILRAALRLSRVASWESGTGLWACGVVPIA